MRQARSFLFGVAAGVVGGLVARQIRLTNEAYAEYDAFCNQIFGTPDSTKWEL